MDIIEQQRPKLNFGPKARAVVYFDSFDISLGVFMIGEFMRSVIDNCGSIAQQDIKDKRGRTIRQLLRINQPSRLIPKILQRYKEVYDPQLNLYRSHAAADVIEIYQGFTKQEVANDLRNHTHLKYRRSKDHIHEIGEGTHSIRTRDRKTRPYRNTHFYDDRPSKVTGEDDALHFEVQNEKNRATKKAGIHNPIDALHVRPDELIERHIIHKDHSLAMQRCERKEMEKMRTLHPKESPTLIRLRVKRMQRGKGLHHISGFASCYPRQFQALPKFKLLDIEDELMWAHKDNRTKDVDYIFSEHLVRRREDTEEKRRQKRRQRIKKSRVRAAHCKIRINDRGNVRLNSLSEVIARRSSSLRLKRERM